MDYKKIYDEFIKYCKNTTIRERLQKRSPNDSRLSKKNIYTEAHHIVPRHAGGGNTLSNLVELLPEEHLFAHKLRYKGYKQRGDMLAVRVFVNRLKDKADPSFKSLKVKSAECPRLTKELLKTVAFIKQNSYEFRVALGWITEDGKKRIGDSRKNTMPVKDKNGNIIGSVSTTHPKVLSGEWVHHSKGIVTAYNEKGEKCIVTCEEYHKNKDKYKYRGRTQKGSKNGNYTDISNDEIIEQYIDISKKLGFICRYECYLMIVNDENNTYKRSPNIRTSFRFGGKKPNLYKIMQSRLPNYFLAVKKGYKTEEKEKYFDGLNQIEYIQKLIKKGVFNDKN